MTNFVGDAQQRARVGAAIVEEVSQALSRTVLDVPAGSGLLSPNLVVAVAAGAYVEFDGSQTDLAVLYDWTYNDAANVQRAVAIQNLAVLSEDELIFPDGLVLTPAQRTAMIAAFWTKFVQIKPQTGVAVD